MGLAWATAGGAFVTSQLARADIANVRAVMEERTKATDLQAEVVRARLEVMDAKLDEIRAKVSNIPHTP